MSAAPSTRVEVPRSSYHPNYNLAGPPGGGSAEDRDPLESSSFALEDELAALKSPTAGESSLELSASRGHGLEFSANIASVEGSQDLDQNYDVVESVEM